MNCETQNAAIRELTQQELENVTGGTIVVSAVAGAAKEVAKEVVKILSTGAIGGINDQGGQGNCTCTHA